MRVIFLGSGKFGLPTLRRLDERHDVVAVVTQPDRPAGRRRSLTPTPIAQWADQQAPRVWRAVDANAPTVIEHMATLKPDAAVVVAFGQKLSQPLINVLGRLVVNLHASLLPKYRGAAPINWAIMRGETQTGLSVISLAQRMDAGLIYGQSTTEIDPLETAGQLHDRLAQIGPSLIERVLTDFESGTLKPQPQDEAQATRAPKLSKADGWVDFHAPANEVCRRVMGLNPWPGVRVNWQRCDQVPIKNQPLALLRVALVANPRDQMPLAPACDAGARGDHASALPKPGTVLTGYRVATGQGAVQLIQVQAPGGKPMNIEDFARGHHLLPGDRLTRITT